MKQRITYLVPNPDDFHPDLLEVESASLSVRDLKAAKEHRLTLALSELPSELRKAFEQWHELHIRWASETPYSAPPPFTSRVSPGLHVFFTPQEDKSEGPICALLREVFGQEISCDDPQEAFTKLPILSERFSVSASSQFYAYVRSSAHFAQYVAERICPPSSTPCKAAAASLNWASYIDIDYDAISHAIILNAFWARAPRSSGWSETTHLPGGQDTIEIGVLNHETNPDPEDIAFSGFLTVLGQDTKPKPTRFQTPTRHYPLPATHSKQTYTTSFQHPTGLHPTLIITLPTRHLQPPAETCKLHTYLTLPSYLFLDRYPFRDDPVFLSAHNIAGLRSLSGATDLEAPDWVIGAWGSAALFEIAIPPSNKKQNTHLNVTIPLHLRYLPAQNASHTRVPVPWPIVFWACNAEEGTKMSSNPFDRRHLGFEGLFGVRTRFVHVPPAISSGGDGNGKLVEWIDVPVLDLRGARWVEVGTVGAVVLAFLGICWVLFWGGSGKATRSVAREKKKQ
ncbi:protein pbn1 [Westerdykella ornata]|uniref:Protein PBN1 n=1 Tax=Westerdykella ornata TaxID=318751 RepID=A0A6A6JGF8_WESOR|nr:protein pbn1 [Westerdykella ornata]KAF2275203.1 protein pbn1 [Westerdykella ornata]